MTFPDPHNTLIETLWLQISFDKNWSIFSELGEGNILTKTSITLRVISRSHYTFSIEIEFKI